MSRDEIRAIQIAAATAERQRIIRIMRPYNQMGSEVQIILRIINSKSVEERMDEENE